MVVVGGTANLFGSLLGAALLTLLEPFLNDHVHTSPERVGLIRYMIYGGLIVLFMLLRPQGLLPEYLTLRGMASGIANLPRRLRELPSLVQQRKVSILVPATAAGVFADPSLAAEKDAEYQEPGSPGGADGARASPQAPTVSEPAAAAERRNGDGTVLQARGLAKRFGGIVAADGLDLELQRGRVTGLIGPNGAGKTTVFNLLTGVDPSRRRHGLPCATRTSPAGP